MLSAVILKLNCAEVQALMEYDVGEYGEDTLPSFLAEMCAKINPETGELDIGRDERERIAEFENDDVASAVMRRIFRRPLEKALKDFFR